MTVFFLSMNESGKRRGTKERSGRLGGGSHATGRRTAGRHRVKAAGVEWRALQEPPHCEQATGQRTMGANRLGGIVRARRCEPAAAGGSEQRRQGGRNRALINPNQKEQQPGGQRGGEREKSRRGRAHGGGMGLVAAAIWRHASENFCASSGIGRSVAAARAMSKRSQPGGTRCCWWRKISRSRRLARLRRTA